MSSPVEVITKPLSNSFLFSFFFFFQKEKAQKSWFEQNAESVELLMDDDESEDERAKNHKQKRISSANLGKLQQVSSVKYFKFLH